jgi:hypothetical protein
MVISIRVMKSFPGVKNAPIINRKARRHLKELEPAAGLTSDAANCYSATHVDIIPVY